MESLTSESVLKVILCVMVGKLLRSFLLPPATVPSSLPLNSNKSHEVHEYESYIFLSFSFGPNPMPYVSAM